MKNEYTTEKEFCEANGFDPQDGICQHESTLPKDWILIQDLLSKYRVYLMEKAEGGKLSLQECREKIVKGSVQYLDRINRVQTPIK